MQTQALDQRARHTLTCDLCGDVIGVYEPIVHVLGATVRRTSRAAESKLCSAPGAHYHLACYQSDASED